MKDSKEKSTKADSNSLLNKLKSSPMWRKESFLLVLALVSALLSSFLKKTSEEKKLNAVRNAHRKVRIVVASKDLAKNSVIQQESVTFKSYLAQNVTTNMIPAKDYQKMKNRNLLLEFKKGDPILSTAVLGLNSGDSMSRNIPLGKRFFILELKDQAVSNGWVRPNDHVDIIVTMNLPKKGSTTFTLLQDITLVSVGGKTSWNDKKNAVGSQIGFYTGPKEFELLKFAQKRGTFGIALRNPKDIVMTNTVSDFNEEGINMDSFLDSGMLRKASGGSELKVKVRGKRK
ncbi:MAG: Flp pilus assembly protein CpaB [Bacteriovoracaceae bacterium]|nr:Flp pilus assembly protein CpaB [Bacteriovoracaceae bacterium]